MSILWLIPSAVLLLAALVVARSATGIRREALGLQEAADDVDVSLEALTAAVRETRAAYGNFDGARSHLPTGASGGD